MQKVLITMPHTISEYSFKIQTRPWYTKRSFAFAHLINIHTDIYMSISFNLVLHKIFGKSKTLPGCCEWTLALSLIPV